MVHFERSPCKRLLHLVMKYPEFWCILSTVHAREIVAFRDEICRFFGASFVVIYIYLFWDCKPMVAGMESRGLNADSRTPHEMSIESSRQGVLAHGVAANRQCGIIVDIMQWCAFVPDHVPAKNTKQNQSFSSFSTRHSILGLRTPTWTRS
jgi:hypothetical protein